MDEDAPQGGGKGRGAGGLPTRLTQLGRNRGTYGLVNPPVLRGSTVLYPTSRDLAQTSRGPRERTLTYGLHGNATHFALEEAVAAIEGGTHCRIVSSGLSACTTALLAFLGAGEHCLIPDSVYGPTRWFADTVLRRFGVATTYYDPEIDGAGLSALLRPETRVLFCESPGSHTFEVQDIPALAAAAHDGGAVVVMDNTWGFGSFQPFRHGVDVSAQALTKYAGGHSDLLLGSITTPDETRAARVRTTVAQLGQHASPDDCWLALRGLRTLAVRLERQARSALTVAAWLAARPEVAEVLYPPLPGARGHALWRRDFDGASSLMGVVFRPPATDAAVEAMADAMTVFGIGESWGGYESLALPTRVTRTAGTGRFAGPMCRLHIGLEEPADLIADLERGLAALRAAAGQATAE